MNIIYYRESNQLVLESENSGEYWQLSWLARETLVREKECDGKTITIRLALEKNQDSALPGYVQCPYHRERNHACPLCEAIWKGLRAESPQKTTKG